MRHITSFSIPKPQSPALVAAGEGANKGFWRRQWRDRYKRFVDMGRSIKFKLRLADGRVVNVIGKFEGSNDAVYGRVYVQGDPNVPDGYYYVTSDNGATVIATLKQTDLDRLGIQPGKDYEGNAVTARDEAAIQDIGTIKYEPKEVASDKPPTERKAKLSGAEAQERKLSTVTQNLKEEGRFPVPRQSNLNFWGEESDIAKGAKEDYNLVYESLKNQDPAWKEKYPTFDDFWGKVKEMAVGQTSQSPNDLSKIPQEMKDINKAYAERVLNMNPDGKITFYRNATNRKGSPEDSALGYVTTNADFAYDYNSGAPNESGNGRYEIDVKPDEVVGMLGYSQLEDEFGVVIGRAVTSQPDRVRRVGDLAQPVLAPWLEKYQDGVGRSTGGTPYRHYALAGQFDLLPVDPLGDTAAEFLEKHGKTAADIKAKFDELYGEGSYDEYKASNESLNFSDIKRLFVDVGDGKVGLDITKIGGMDGALAPGGYGNGDPASFKNDKTDNTLKMLSVFQELSGQPFMVHRSRTDELPAKPEDVVAESELNLEFKNVLSDHDYLYNQKLDLTELPVPKNQELKKVDDVLIVANSDGELPKSFVSTAEDLVSLYPIDKSNNAGLAYGNKSVTIAYDPNLLNAIKVQARITPQWGIYLDVNNGGARNPIIVISGDPALMNTDLKSYSQTENSIKIGLDQLLATEDGLDPSITVADYRVAHEFGHMLSESILDAKKMTSGKILDAALDNEKYLKTSKQHMSGYGYTNPKEMYAEAFAAWYVTKGKATSPIVRDFAERFEWKVPKDELPTTPEATPQQPQEPKELDNYFADEPETESTNSFSNPFTENPDLTEFEDEILEWFTDDGYEKVSDFLREGKAVSDSSKEKIKVLLDLIDRSEIKVDTLIYRGRVFNKFNDDQFQKILKLKVGDEYSDAGITSNTTDRNRTMFYADMDMEGATGRAIYRVVARKGQKGFKIPDSSSSYGNSEQEVLLPPNTKYKVIGVNNVDGVRVLDLEIVDQPPKKQKLEDYLPTAEPVEETNPEPEATAPEPAKLAYDRITFLTEAKTVGEIFAQSSSQEVKDFVKSHFDYKETPEHVAAVNLYVGDDEKTLNRNKNLREGLDAGEVEQIDAWTRSGSVSKPTRVFRGIIASDEVADSYKVGSSVIDSSFTSVAVNSKQARIYQIAREQEGIKGKRVTFSIDLDVGTPVGVATMGELVLPRGLSYEVIENKTLDSGNRIIKLKVKKIEPNPEPVVPQKPQPDQALQGNYSSQEMSAIYNYIFEDKINETIGALKDKPIQSYIDAANGKNSDVSLDGLTKDQLDALKSIEGLDSAIANTKFETDTSVHRGIRISPENFEDFASRATEGSTWSSPTFSSTSKDPDIAERFATDVEGMVPVIIQYDMPKGSSGLDIDILDINGGYGDEAEVLLARDAKFEIVSAIRMPLGSNDIDGLALTVRPKIEAPKPAAPIPTPIKPLPKVKPKEKVKVDRNTLPMPQVEVDEPVYNILNSDKPVFIQGNIAVPDSSEARALSQIGKDPTKKERDALRKKTLEVLTKDPNYKPLPPETANFDALTSVGESAFTYVDSSLLINNGLRDADPDMENSKQVKDIDEAMLLSAHLPPGTTVYRMLKLSTWERLNPQPGQVLIDRAYSSTSHTKVFSDEARDIDIQTGDVNQIPMRIVMPNNTSGIDLSTISWYDTEDEYLLPRQTALRFLGWDSDGYAVFERIN